MKNTVSVGSTRHPKSLPSLLLLVLGMAVFFLSAAYADPVATDAGPENGGLRLHLKITPEASGSDEKYHVWVDLLNVSDHPIKLVAEWDDDSQMGDFKNYLESVVSVETYPEIRPVYSSIVAGHRTSPQPEYMLPANGALSLEWTSTGRRLKNKTISFYTTLNPAFPSDGLYSVHFTAKLRLGEPETNQPPAKLDPRVEMFLNSQPRGAVFLRSNEQLVSVGGKQELPQSTLARVLSTDTNKLTARIDLGMQQKVKPGQEFGILSTAWKVRVTKVESSASEGDLLPLLGNENALKSALRTPIPANPQAVLLPPSAADLPVNPSPPQSTR